MIQFTTARCLVRWITEDDLPALLAVYGDPETVRYVGDRTPLTPELCRRWLQVTTANYAARGYGMFAIVEHGGGEAIGFCGIVHPNGQPTPEIKYAFRRDTWGRRFASEIAPALLAHGFGTLGLERIIATVHPDNAPSIRVLQALGMRRERTVTHEDGERTITFALERRRTALLLIDLQEHLFDPAAPVSGAAALLARLRVVLGAARGADVPVIFVRNDGGAGNPDARGTPGWELHGPFTPRADELVLDRTTADTFASTPLAAILQARGVERMVIAGLQSESCIRETSLGALERGFEVVLVRDGHSTHPSAGRPAVEITEAVNTELAPRVTAVRAEELTF